MFVGDFLYIAGALGFLLVLEIMNRINDVSLLLRQRRGRWKAVVVGPYNRLNFIY